jgi:hypothetical protein
MLACSDFLVERLHERLNAVRRALRRAIDAAWTRCA